MSKWPGLKWFWFIPVIFLLDQGSKWFIVKHLSYRELLAVIPSLNFTLTYNPGVAFSLFDQQIGWVPLLLTLFVSLIALMVAYWLSKTPWNEKWNGFALAFILGGALGNLYDRIAYGHVIDFIDFYIQHWHFYTFNIADSFITVGAMMMIKASLFPAREVRCV